MNRLASPALFELLEGRSLLTITVSSLADSGEGTLRQAILDGNASPSGTSIVLSFVAQPRGNDDIWHVKLSSPLPAITKPLTITNATGISAHTRIEPAGTSPDWDGLTVSANDCSFQYLDVTGFRNGFVINGSYNRLGSSTAASPANLNVANNAVDGIRIESGFGNQVFSGSYSGNGRLGINLGTDGATPNDPLDADTGPDTLLNKPVLLTATSNASEFHVSGRMEGVPNSTQRVFFYSSDVAANAPPDAKFFITDRSLQVGGDGTAAFDLTLPNSGTLPTGGSVTAFAVDINGNTSELAQPVNAQFNGSLVVTNVNASGPGSLVQAVKEANAHVGVDTVTFNIPGTGVHRIVVPGWSVPYVTDGFVDGTSQPGYAGSPVIELVNSDTARSRTGISVTGTRGGIKGLAVGGYDTGIGVYGTGLRVEACYSGLMADGTVRANNVGIQVSSIGYFTGNLIGGLNPAARNIVSGNLKAGIQLEDHSRSTLVVGNYVGTSVDGLSALPNGTGIQAIGVGDTIGGTIAAARNVISGNTYNGILLDEQFDSGSSAAAHNGNRVIGNVIGLNAAGDPLPNGAAGIRAVGIGDVIGGTIPGAANVIAHNSAAGVIVSAANWRNSGTQERILGNSVYGNGIGILLVPGGSTWVPTEPGGNLLQPSPHVDTTIVDAATTTVSGALNAAPNATFTLDFYASDPFDPSGVIQGRTYLGSCTVTTDASGAAPFTASFGVSAEGQGITATATDAAGNTSAFSQPCFTDSLPGPAVVAADFVYNDGPHRIRLTFTRDLDPTAAAALSPADLTVLPLTGGTVLRPDGVTYDPRTRTATYTFVSKLPDGDYRATLAPHAIVDTSGQLMPAPFSFNFFSLQGDVNRDRRVDFNDLIRIAQHYNTFTADYSTGDLTGDGNVDFYDLTLLAQNYQQSLPALPVTTVAVSVPATAPALPASPTKKKP